MSCCKASLGRKGKFGVSAEPHDFPPSLNQVIMLDSIENFIWHLFILCYQAATMAKRKFYQAGRKTLW